MASHGLAMEKVENFSSRGLVVNKMGAELGSPWKRHVSLASRGLAVGGGGRGLLPLRGWGRGLLWSPSPQLMHP